jgi:ABC-type multidrug transport system ATPase subunit
MLLTVEGISKRFRNQLVLQNVSFSVRPAEVLGLIGPNGAGKTTLFECLAGLLPRNAGTLYFGSQTLRGSNLKQTLFYMPDGIAPWPVQTVSWALGFFKGLYPAADVAVSDLVDSLRLGGLLKSRIGTLSKGERKRTMLALALLTTQPLLLLDEPFDGLDLRQTRDAMSLLRNHAARGRTLMLSIHQLVDAARVCDRLVLLAAGKVAGEGTVPELQSRANLDEGGLEEIFLALT